MQFPPDLIEALKKAKSVVVLTGAGVSAESGIPTFRDAMKGLWAKFDPMELATPEAFERNPENVSRWYDDRRLDCLKYKPNPGHYALATMESYLQKRGTEFTLLTQNVDRLHQRAGSRNVAELHGALDVWFCIRCGKRAEEESTAFGSYPPRCDCGGIKRPGVVWFGEILPPDALRIADRALRECELFFSIGTSALVYPVAGFVDLARSCGARTVEINISPTPATPYMDWFLQGKSGYVLPRFLEALGAGGATG